MNQAEETASLRRGIRIDLVIALCALIISSLATAASWWQSRIVAEQLSSQVWPYLTFSTMYDPQYLSVEVVNDGLGPAIIRSAVLTVDGTPYPDPAVAFLHVFKPERGSFGSQITGLSPGSVVRASGSAKLFRLNAPWAARQYAAAVGRVDFRICYCSLLENCWLISSQQNTGGPIGVARCADVGSAQYRVAPMRS